MNTRFKKLKPIPPRPSVNWHLMHEEYYPIFAPEFREKIEYWYNKTATGKQRDTFRRICSEIYTHSPPRDEPKYEANYTRQVALCETALLIRHYGVVLSEDGKRRARSWIPHASERDKMGFREVFTGAQSSFIPNSVMKVDYIAPGGEYYENIDREYFLNSVDWANIDVQKEMQARQRRRGMSLPANIVYRQMAANRPRVTKPKNQFDGFTPLTALGYTDTNEDEAIEKLRTKLYGSTATDSYYTVDGCTVYVAGSAKKSNPGTANSIKGGVIATLIGDS